MQDVADIPRNNQNNNRRNGEEAMRNNDQFNMQQMAGRLRDFLETMDHEFPAAEPVDQVNENDLPELDDFD